VISEADGTQWQLKIESSSMPFTLSHGEQRDHYYVPFPGFNCYPVTITLDGTGPVILSYAISAR
jgi:hypothetical protein